MCASTAATTICRKVCNNDAAACVCLFGNWMLVLVCPAEIGYTCIASSQENRLEQVTWSSTRCQWKRLSLCSAMTSRKRFMKGSGKKWRPQSSNTPRHRKRGASTICGAADVC